MPTPSSADSYARRARESGRDTSLSDSKDAPSWHDHAALGVDNLLGVTVVEIGFESDDLASLDGYVVMSGEAKGRQMDSEAFRAIPKRADDGGSLPPIRGGDDETVLDNGVVERHVWLIVGGKVRRCVTGAGG